MENKRKYQTRKYFEDLFDECCKEIPLFKDLDYPTEFRWSLKAKDYAGKCTWWYKDNSRKEIVKTEIMLNAAYSAFYGYEEDKETMKHEMLHLWEVRKYLDSDHGRLFQYLAEMYGIEMNCEKMYEATLEQKMKAISDAVLKESEEF